MGGEAIGKCAAEELHGLSYVNRIFLAAQLRLDLKGAGGSRDTGREGVAIIQTRDNDGLDREVELVRSHSLDTL